MLSHFSATDAKHVSLSFCYYVILADVYISLFKSHPGLCPTQGTIPQTADNVNHRSTPLEFDPWRFPPGQRLNFGAQGRVFAFAALQVVRGQHRPLRHTFRG